MDAALARDHRGSFTVIACLAAALSFTVNEAGSGHLIHILGLFHRSGTPLGEREAFVLLVWVAGRADVLAHRWATLLGSGVLFWSGSHFSHPGNRWVPCTKFWNCSHLPTPPLMWKNDSGAADGS